MKPNKSLLLVIFLLTVFSIESAYASDFKVADLSKEGQAAYNQLLNARAFSIGLVGWGSRQSINEIALRALLREKKAVKALKSLLRSATAEGSLYALFGLRVKDKGGFKKELEIYKFLSESPERKYDSRSDLKIPAGDVLTARGCIVMNSPRQRVIKLIETGNYDEAFRLNKSGADYILENGTLVRSN